MDQVLFYSFFCPLLTEQFNMFQGSKGILMQGNVHVCFDINPYPNHVVYKGYKTAEYMALNSILNNLPYKIQSEQH